MMTHAYMSDYVPYVQNNLGHLFDFAVNECNVMPDEITTMFIRSGVAAQIEIGNPRYLVGLTGPEIFRVICSKLNFPEPRIPDVMYLDKSAQYWAGWLVAYYQWHASITFLSIFTKVSLAQIINMYYPLHEASLVKCVTALDKLTK